MTTKRNGFTLLELSMVVAIIGLIIGGIMVGRSIITTASYQAQISEMTKIKSSIMAFRMKYNCLPGDCREATRFFPAAEQPEAVLNGNGNRRINIMPLELEPGDQNAGWGPSDISGGAYYSEWTGVFDQLAAANMYEFPRYDEGEVPTGSGGAGVVCPHIKFESKGGASEIINAQAPACTAVGYIGAYEYVPDGHKIVIGGGALEAGQAAGINPWEAEFLDSKLDDGRPKSGQMVVMANGYIYRLSASQACWNFYDDTMYYNEAAMRNLPVATTIRYRACAIYWSAGF